MFPLIGKKSHLENYTRLKLTWYCMTCYGMFPEKSMNFPSVIRIHPLLSLLWPMDIHDCLHCDQKIFMEIHYKNIYMILLFPVVASSLFHPWLVWPLDEILSPPIKILNPDPFLSNPLINSWMTSLHPTNDISSL